MAKQGLRFVERCVTPPEEDPTIDPVFKTLCPTEFKMRIMIGMLNGIEYDATTTGEHDQSDYIESIEKNRGFKCYAARHVYFT